MATIVRDKEVKDLFKQIRRLFPIDIKAGNRAMLVTEERIKDRTLSGVDVNNFPFAEYSEGYAAFRLERGHKISPVDLFFSGEMFASMTHTVTKDSMEIFFDGAKDEFGDTKAERHVKGLGGLPVRDFFGVNASDLDRILDTLIEPFDRL